MPTNLRCKMCGSHFYTAVDKEYMDNMQCQDCSGQLEVLEHIECEDEHRGKCHARECVSKNKPCHAKDSNGNIDYVTTEEAIFACRDAEREVAASS